MNLGQHTLKAYDKQLERLLALILEMGGHVRAMVLAARRALRARDPMLVAAAKKADKQINDLDQAIEEQATLVLALQNPLAVDLRFVTSALKIAGMLERAGDLAKNTVKRSAKMGDYAPDAVLAELEAMSDSVVAMLGDALQAFEERDARKATQVWKRDDEVDDAYRRVFLAMQREMTEHPENAASCTHIVFAAKNLERIADYTTNLAKTVYYVTSGKRADKAILKDDSSA